MYSDAARAACDRFSEADRYCGGSADFRRRKESKPPPASLEVAMANWKTAEDLSVWGDKSRRGVLGQI